MARQWPSVAVGVAFTPGVFTETTLAKSAGGAEAFSYSRGRQYELGRTDAGTGTVAWDNRDGRYTPNNASSPYAGLLKLYNEIKLEATWAGTPYPVMRGFVERWPTGYGSGGGNFSTTAAPIVDGLAVLAGQTLRAAYDHEVLADSPLAYYPLDEESDSTSGGDVISPTVHPAAALRDSKYGGTTAAFGAALDLPDSATGVSLANTGALNVATTLLALAINSPVGAYVNSTAGFAVEAWVQPSTTKPVTKATINFQGRPDGYFLWVGIDSSGHAFLSINNLLGTVTYTGTTDVCDGEPHHIVAALDAAGVNMAVYVDGVSEAGGSYGTVCGFAGLSNNTVGGYIATSGATGYGLNGVISRLAVYAGGLTAARVLAHYEAGITSFAAEDSGARISRILDYAGWPPALYDVGSGSSTMGPCKIAGTNALEALQKVADDELGQLWVTGAGKVTFRGRQVRQANLTSSFTFGEDTAAGEIPYLGDIEFDYDPTYVISTQRVTRDGGASFLATATSTVLPYAKAGQDRSIGVANDAEAADQANWLIAQYSLPRLRVVSLTIDPGANPTLWPKALGTEIGTRVTVKRRAKNQPTVSIDCWVEAVGHQVSPTAWLTTFQLSPVDTPRAGLWDTDNWDDTTAVWSF